MGGAIVIAGVVPFLMFFMLVRKDHIYSWMLSTFGTRVDIPRFVARVNGMVRGFVVGDFIIAAVMAVVTITVLLAIHLEGAVALGIASAALNLIPFIGLALSAALLLLAGTLQFSTLTPYLVILLTVALLHLISANLLIPKFIGSRVNVDPVAATTGMLFWGWLWEPLVFCSPFH
jgi:predicted PurR-regulated permease PerM